MHYRTVCKSNVKEDILRNVSVVLTMDVNVIGLTKIVCLPTFFKCRQKVTGLKGQGIIDELTELHFLDELIL